MCGGDLGPFYFSLFYYNSLVLSGEKLSQILVPFLDFFGSFLFSLPCFHSFSLPLSLITIWYHLPRWRSWSFSIIPSSKLAVRSPTTPNTNVSSCCPSSGYQLTIPFFFLFLLCCYCWGCSCCLGHHLHQSITDFWSFSFGWVVTFTLTFARSRRPSSTNQTAAAPSLASGRGRLDQLHLSLLFPLLL